MVCEDMSHTPNWSGISVSFIPWNIAGRIFFLQYTFLFGLIGTKIWSIYADWGETVEYLVASRSTTDSPACLPSILYYNRAAITNVYFLPTLTTPVDVHSLTTQLQHA